MKTMVKKPETHEDLLALPESWVGELVAGELHATSRPAARQLLVASALGGELVGPFQRGRGGPGGWWLLDELEIHLGQEVLVPDLAGWRRTRMPVLSDQPFVTLSPDWVCEVLSPATAGFDRVRKMPVYLRERVEHVWLIDPLNRTLEVFQNENERWVLVGNHAGDQRARAAPFEAIELELEAFWLPGPSSG